MQTQSPNPPIPVPDRTTQDQIEARKFLNQWFRNPALKQATLLGYAGTGKTWLIGDWLSELLQISDQSDSDYIPPPDICIAAPTHKALDVLRQKCGSLPVTFKTLHSLLGMIIAKQDDGEISKEFAGRDERYDLLVVDEGSMVSAEFKNLIDAELRPGGRIGKVLYVGDPAQLPPVKEDMSPIFKIEHSFTLTQVVRYDSAILNVATFLRTKISEAERFTLLDIMDVVKQTPNDRSVSIITKGAMHDWAYQAIQKDLDCRILAWTNAAVMTHNQIMHARCFPNAKAFFAEGEKILLNDAYTLRKDQGGRQKNDQEPPDSLYNGEVLKTVAIYPDEDIAGVKIWKVEATRATGHVVTLAFAPNEAHRAAVHKEMNENIYHLGRQRYDNPEKAAQFNELTLLRRKINRLAPLRHAFANTVHKSQGSTYDISMVDFSDVYRSDDRARLMYVGATRPSKFLVLAR